MSEEKASENHGVRRLYAIDEAAARVRAAAELRLAEVLRGYEQTLGMEHPEARAAASGTRLTAEIEPYDG